MKQLNNKSFVSFIDEDKEVELKKIVKKRKLKNSNEESSNFDSFINFIDSKNIDEMKKLIKTFNKNNKNNIIFKMYNNKLLSVERLQFIMENCAKYLSISSKLVKRLIKEEKETLHDIIFSHFKFFSNEFILQFFLFYNNKTAISTSNLNQ